MKKVFVMRKKHRKNLFFSIEKKALRAGCAQIDMKNKEAMEKIRKIW